MCLCVCEGEVRSPEEGCRHKRSSKSDRSVETLQESILDRSKCGILTNYYLGTMSCFHACLSFGLFASDITQTCTDFGDIFRICPQREHKQLIIFQG